MLEPLNNSLVCWGEGTHTHVLSRTLLVGICFHGLQEEPPPPVVRSKEPANTLHAGHVGHYLSCGLFSSFPKHSHRLPAPKQLAFWWLTPLTTGRRLPRLAAYSRVAFVGGRFFACSQRANKWQPQANLAGWRTWQHTSHASWIKKGLANESIIG